MKQDHRTYTRAQVDFLRVAEARQATREAVKYYNCAIIMCLMDMGLTREQIQDFAKNSESIFESIKEGALSFADCIEDIRKNTGIEVLV